MIAQNHSLLICFFLFSQFPTIISSSFAVENIMYGDDNCYQYNQSFLICNNHSIIYPQPKHLNPWYEALLQLEETDHHWKKVSIDCCGMTEACTFSRTQNYSLSVGTTTIPLIITEIPTVCRSTGNYFGEFYNLMNFALDHGLAIARVPIRQDRYNCLGSKTDSTELVDAFPRLIIPLSVFNMERDYPEIARKCKDIKMFPWDTVDENMWTHPDLIVAVNHGISKNMLSHPRNMMLKELIESEAKAVHIQLRCSDSVSFSGMGVLDFKTFEKVLKEIHARKGEAIELVIIHTDANIHHDYGRMCSIILAELESFIPKQHGYHNADVSIEHSSAVHAFLRMHGSAHLICSSSTFCLFAAFGSDDAYVISAAETVVRNLPTRLNDEHFHILGINPPYFMGNRKKPSQTEEDFLKLVVGNDTVF